MRIESAIEHDNWLEVVIDGRRLQVGEKYTILELGYAVYLMDQNDEKWLLENGDSIPEDPRNLIPFRSDYTFRNIQIGCSHFGQCAIWIIRHRRVYHTIDRAQEDKISISSKNIYNIFRFVIFSDGLYKVIWRVYAE